eukprot:8340641-Heterocapsa_arctica.AAC.1
MNIPEKTNLTITIEDCIIDMMMNKKGQNDIYCIIGENIASSFLSSSLETIRKKIEAQSNHFIMIIPDK